jgi:hypothetical protein
MAAMAVAPGWGVTGVVLLAAEVTGDAGDVGLA